MSPPFVPRTFGGWFRFICGALLIVGAAYVSWLVWDSNQRGRSDTEVLASVDQAIQNQQATGQSTECSRAINSGGEVVQLDFMDTLADAFVDGFSDGEVSPETFAAIAEFQRMADEAKAAYREINERCPAVTGSPPSTVESNPND